MFAHKLADDRNLSVLPMLLHQHLEGTDSAANVMSAVWNAEISQLQSHIFGMIFRVDQQAVCFIKQTSKHCDTTFATDMAGNLPTGLEDCVA